MSPRTSTCTLILTVSKSLVTVCFLNWISIIRSTFCSLTLYIHRHNWIKEALSNTCYVLWALFFFTFLKSSSYHWLSWFHHLHISGLQSSVWKTCMVWIIIIIFNTFFPLALKWMKMLENEIHASRKLDHWINMPMIALCWNGESWNSVLNS